MLTLSESLTRRSIPFPLTSFVGRADIIDALLDLLQRSDTRLLTLTGPGGIGKTRLALEVMNRLAPTFSDELYFLSLASLQQPDDVLPAIAKTFDLWDAQSAPLVPRLGTVLPTDPVLLVLDNVEHVVDSATDIAKFLAAYPQVTVLATSRIPLHIQGEREYAVPQLTVPEPECPSSLDELANNESVALFVERAQSINPTFALTDENAQTIAQICKRLGGLPLAIELAAARTKSLPLAALLNRLDNSLQLLGGGARDLPPRLQTMRATIAWSYDLLDDAEQQLFRHLAVFQTGFTLEAAEVVAADASVSALDGVASLVDKSLITLGAHEEDTPSYEMMGVVREYGIEQLRAFEELERARGRHLRYYADLVHSARQEFLGPRQRRWLNVFDQRYEDLRAALTWSTQNGEWLLAARLAGTLWVFWWVRCYLVEGRHWLTTILAHASDLPSDLLVGLHFGAGMLAFGQLDQEEARGHATALNQIATKTGDSQAHALSRFLAGLGRLDETSSQSIQEAADTWQGLGNDVWLSVAKSELAVRALESGNLDGALQGSREAYELSQESGHSWGIAFTMAGLARVLRRRGQRDESLGYYKESLRLLTELGDRVLLPTVLENLAGLAASAGQYEQCARTFGYTALIRETMAFPPRLADRRMHEESIALTRNHLSPDAFEQAWQAGRQMSLLEAVDEVLSIDLGGTSLERSDARSMALLTPREQEVMQRIASGMTDQEIADNLFVSYRTVTTHVTNILNKLGAGSRTEAAAIAVRDQLI